jgi:hypothetical protein
VFEDHSFHFGIEFIINFLFHFPVHCFHEFLKNIFEVLDVDAFVDLLIEGFVDAHDVRGFGKGGVVTADISEALLHFVDGLEDLEDEADDAVVSGYRHQVARVDVVSEDLHHFPAEVVHQLLSILVVPEISVVLHDAVDELLKRNDVFEVEVFLQEGDRFGVDSSIVLDRLFFLEQSPPEDDGGVALS